MRENFRERPEAVEVIEAESEPTAEVLGNINEFSAAKSVALEPRTYMLR